MYLLYPGTPIPQYPSTPVPQYLSCLLWVTRAVVSAQCCWCWVSRRYTRDSTCRQVLLSQKIFGAAISDQGEEDDDEGPQQQRHHHPLGAGLGGHGAQVPAQAHLPPALRVLQAAAAPLHLGPLLLDSGQSVTLILQFPNQSN